MDEHPNPKEILVSGASKELTLPAEMVSRGLRLAEKAENRLGVQTLPLLVRSFQGIRHKSCVNFSQNGNFAVIARIGIFPETEEPELLVWDVQAGKVIPLSIYQVDPRGSTSVEALESSLGSMINCAAISPEGDFVLAGYGNETALLWNVAEGYFPIILKDTEQESSEPIRSVAYSADKIVYAMTLHGQVIVRLISGHNHLAICKIPQPQAYYNQMAFSKENGGGKIVVASIRPNGMAFYDNSYDNRGMIVFPGAKNIAAVSLFPGDRSITSMNLEGIIAIWDIDTKIEVCRWPHAAGAPNFAGVLASEKAEGLGDVQSDYPLWAYSSVAVSPDGTSILSGGADGFMRLWTLEGRQLYEFPHQHRLIKVAFVPDGRHVLSGCLDGSVYLWQLPAYTLE